MEILEFGDRNKRKIIFIHGFQCPYQIQRKLGKSKANLNTKLKIEIRIDDIKKKAQSS